MTLHRRRPATLLGLDLSVRAAAAVAVPLDWAGDWSRVRTLVVGEDLRLDATDEARALRTGRIAAALVAFARSTSASVAWIEGYAYSQRTAAHTLGELGGVVRLELVRAGLAVRTANVSTARKLLLGGVPKRGAKDAVGVALRAAGCPFATADETDAFCAVNLGLADAGAHCFATAPRPRGVARRAAGL